MNGTLRDITCIALLPATVGFLLLALLTSGCAGCGFDGVPSNEPLLRQPDRAAIVEIVDTARLAAQDELGVNLPSDVPPITFVHGPCLRDTGLDAACLSGITVWDDFGDREVFVAADGLWGEADLASIQTSLVHEMMHVWLDGDVNHKTPVVWDAVRCRRATLSRTCQAAFDREIQVTDGGALAHSH